MERRSRRGRGREEEKRRRRSRGRRMRVGEGLQNLRREWKYGNPKMEKD